MRRKESDSELARGENGGKVVKVRADIFFSRGEGIASLLFSRSLYVLARTLRVCSMWFDCFIIC